MDRALFTSSRPSCLFCEAIQLRTSFRAIRPRPVTILIPRLSSQRIRNASSRGQAHILGTLKAGEKDARPQPRQTRLSSQDSSRIKRLADHILHHHSIPPEGETLRALKAIETTAQDLFGVQDAESRKKAKSGDKTPASALLSLDSRPSSAGRPTTESVEFLSQLAFDIVENERVDITPPILKAYVNIQSLLVRPSTLPDVFSLYRTKPIASKKSSSDQSPIKFELPASNAIATAVPTPVANLALNTAIRARDLDAALDIINTTFRTKSFERNKLFRNALPPVTAACLAPFAAYSIATHYSAFQNNLPVEDATAIAFAGFTAYVAVASMFGYVAVTTKNDQMERVTWIVGLPLWERWAREEERAACDAVAKAWGFREKSRWGEEEGEQWEGLKEWLGVRGMILDKVGLMEGME